jgi:hypothetical protein
MARARGDSPFKNDQNSSTFLSPFASIITSTSHLSTRAQSRKVRCHAPETRRPTSESPRCNLVTRGFVERPWLRRTPLPLDGPTIFSDC